MRRPASRPDGPGAAAPRHRRAPGAAAALLAAALLPGADVPVAVGGPLLRLPPAERAAAIDRLAAASQVSWPAGRCTAAEAVARLAAGGQPVRLSGDGGASAELPAFAGPFWAGAAVVAEAFGLGAEPAPVMARSGDLDLAAGPLALAPGGEGWRPAGALAVAARGDGGALLRLEPRIPPAAVGGLAWERDADAADPAQGPRRGAAAVAIVEAWSAQVPIAVGRMQPLDLGGLPGAVELSLQGGAAALRCSLPTELIVGGGPASFVLRLLHGDQIVRPRGGARIQTGQIGGVPQMVRAGDAGPPPAGPAAAGIWSLARAGTARFPVEIAAARPAGGAATPVAWPAGRRTLGEAIAMLAVDGNAVLLELGEDPRTAADLPAAAGTWWEAVLAVCRAFGLTVLPPRTGTWDEAPLPIGAEAVCLGRAGPERPGPESLIASGAALVQAPRLVAGAPALLYARVRIEPRWDGIDLSASRIAWTMASLDDGAPVAIASDQADQQQGRIERRGLRIGRGVRFLALPDEQPAEPPLAELRLPAQAGGRLSVAGRLSVQASAMVQGEALLRPGEPAAIVLGRRQAVLAELLAPAAALAHGLPPGAWLALGGEDADGIAVLAGPPEGPLAACEQGGVQLHGWRPARTVWPLPVPAGPARIALSAMARGDGLICDLRFAVDIPGG